MIKDFVDPDALSKIIADPIAVEQFDPKMHSLESVKAIFAGCPDGSGQVLIQLFEQRRLIATKNVAIFFSGNTFERMSDTGLTLDTKLLAVLDARTSSSRASTVCGASSTSMTVSGKRLRPK